MSRYNSLTRWTEKDVWSFSLNDISSNFLLLSLRSNVYPQNLPFFALIIKRSTMLEMLKFDDHLSLSR